MEECPQAKEHQWLLEARKGKLRDSHLDSPKEILSLQDLDFTNSGYDTHANTRTHIWECHNETPCITIINKQNTLENNLKEEKFIFTHSFRECIPWLLGRTSWW
jgi:hypothetical protein